LSEFQILADNAAGIKITFANKNWIGQLKEIVLIYVQEKKNCAYLDVANACMQLESIQIESEKMHSWV
jgi:hypothetical protein